MRARTFWGIGPAGFLLLFIGLAVSAGLLPGCSKGEAPNGQARPARVPTDGGEASAPFHSSDAMQSAMAGKHPSMGGGIRGTVLETMNASRYTYLLVDQGGESVWVAVPMCDLAVGDQVVVTEGMPMSRFHSETLDRTFDTIYFSAGLRRQGAGDAAGGMPPGHPDLSGNDSASDEPEAEEIDFTGLKRPEGGVTVSELFADQENLAGKEVLLRGKVVKFNRMILGKNWMHIQDGTGEKGSNDLTINTQAAAAVGDTVLVRGTVVKDKDFGYGYRYDVLIEDAEVTKE